MAHILIVDDEPRVAKAHERTLTRAGYYCTIAGSADEALLKIEEQPVDLVLTDVKMPGRSGLELNRTLSKDFPSIPFIIISGVDDPKIAELAIKRGVYGYLIKPVEKTALLIGVSGALKRRDLELENFRQRHELEVKVKYLERDLQRLSGKVNDLIAPFEDHCKEAIQRIVRIIDLRLRENNLRGQRIGHCCEILAKGLAMDPDDCIQLRYATLLRDVGKVGISDDILFKDDDLSEEEERLLRSHTEIGYNLLAGTGVPLLDLAASIARSHHERFDGTGYPRQLVGDAIPVEGRIVALADGFDSLSLPLDETVEAINRDRGRRYDPTLVETFLDLIPDILRVKHQFADR